ncbi:MAG: hypothetical protein Q4C84_07460 [Bacillota bacterium]|nr:hypothetical protein [Bacillota bacterium]
MTRENMLQIVQELISVLSEKKVTPQEAETIGEAFWREIIKKNEEEKRKYMTEAFFGGASPEK